MASSSSIGRNAKAAWNGRATETGDDAVSKAMRLLPYPYVKEVPQEGVVLKTKAAVAILLLAHRVTILNFLRAPQMGGKDGASLWVEQFEGLRLLHEAAGLAFPPTDWRVTHDENTQLIWEFMKEDHQLPPRDECYTAIEKVSGAGG